MYMNLYKLLNERSIHERMGGDEENDPYITIAAHDMKSVLAEYPNAVELKQVGQIQVIEDE